MFIRYTVTEYEAWREGFDAHETAREAVGMRNTKVYRSTETPNEVVLVLDIEDRLRVEAFASSEEVRLSNMRLGVVSTPERYFVE